MRERSGHVGSIVSTCAGDRFPLTWIQIEDRAKSRSWKNLSPELRLNLEEEAKKSRRMGIVIDFVDLGFRILRIAAELDPAGTWESRLSQLERHPGKLLGDRHPARKYVNRCS